jgi:hypothetical protein
VLAGAVLAFQQLTDDRQQATATQELTRQGQASERFTRAIDQLGSDRLEVRLGGIYGLEQIAQQAPDNRLAVTQVLIAYLHRSSPAAARPTTQPAESTTQPVEPLRVRAPDVQAALTILVRRKPLATDPRLDLSDLDLRGTDLRGATFSQVYLEGADFRDADLRGADLEHARPPMGAPIESYPGNFLPEDRFESGMDKADFHGALVDTSTKPQQGFDWRAAGATMT